MYRLLVLALLCSFLFLFTSTTSAQNAPAGNIVHIQKCMLSKASLGDDAKLFTEMLQKQAEVSNKDPRIVSSRILRHFWGANNRDLILISEFKSMEDLLSFSKDMDAVNEKAFSKEVNEKYNQLWDKHVMQHSDEIYQEVINTRK